ncbi:ACT domain-containing protein [Fimbriimonas ginsengisoli]|uniref:CASTOR ACT domain-containing protein n=1 Tax=Fimbriimonas ginsengisoli Gsoil 348 TaxID=661478 RepID=A0A068NIQ9_FIMGI|nr:ACT domain-containing protein [Fimbriimonas ginsengisoli]AIE83416.1 hypothetical protein OP10G_0048 [Fimbriimonas ginsengisoli Gsoil 348]
MTDGVDFRVLEGRFALVKLPSGSEVPPCPPNAEIWSVTVTEDEVSLVCPEGDAPTDPDEYIERSWRCIKVSGPLDFQLKGILVSLLEPLASAGVSVFALSTYFTDYILVKEHALKTAIEALTAAGHRS